MLPGRNAGGRRAAPPAAPSLDRLRDLVESPRVVLATAGGVVLAAVVVAVLLLRVLLGGADADDDAGRAEPGGSTSKAPEPAGEVRRTDPQEPATAAYAVNVLGDALTMNRGQRTRFLRLHTAPEERDRVEELIDDWQRRLLVGLDARGLRAANLEVTGLGHRALGLETRREERVLHLLLLCKVEGRQRGGGRSAARFLAKLSLTAGPAGLQVAGLAGMKQTRARRDPTSPVFFPVSGGSR